MIPDAAVEAAARAMYAQDGGVGEFNLWVYQDYAKAMLEAAAPHMLSHEREETRLAHVDAVVNAETVDRLEKELAEAREESVVSDERKVTIHRTSESLQSYKNIPEQRVTISTVEDLEAICVKYDDPIILTVGKDGKLESIEIYDDYRE